MIGPSLLPDCFLYAVKVKFERRESFVVSEPMYLDRQVH